MGGPLLWAGGILPVDVHAVESAIEAETREGSGEAAAEALVRGDEGKGVGATGAAEGDEELGTVRAAASRRAIAASPSGRGRRSNATRFASRSTSTEKSNRWVSDAHVAFQSRPSWRYSGR